MSAINAGLAELAERRAALEAESESVDGQLTEKRRAASASRRALEEAQEEADAVRNIISGHTLKMEGRVKREETARQKMRWAICATFAGRLVAINSIQAELTTARPAPWVTP